MDAAATSDVLAAFPTTALASLNSAAAASILASTEYGCPLSDFESLADQCALTSLPSCVAAQITGTATAIDYDAACCTSLSVYAVSVGSCVSKNAPTCLNTSALLASATAASAAEMTASVSDPCAKYFGKGGGSGPVATPAPSAKAASGATGASGGTATATSSGGSATAAQANRASKTGPGLKVYFGLGLMVSLVGLTL